MSDSPNLHCPVCRAKQTLRATCRRCNADLRLVAGARHRIGYVRAELVAARSAGNQHREASLAAELQWLDPNGRFL